MKYVVLMLSLFFSAALQAQEVSSEQEGRGSTASSRSARENRAALNLFSTVDDKVQAEADKQQPDQNTEKAVDPRLRRFQMMLEKRLQIDALTS